MIDEILDLFKICMGQNYFTYKGKYYLQNEGLPMGSPTSPTLANIFTKNFEKSSKVENLVKYCFDINM